MILYLVRHGDAVDPSPPFLADEARYLTELGRLTTGLVARELASESIDLFLTSPLVRAVQTTELLCKDQRSGPRVEVLGALDCGVPAGRVLQALEELVQEERVALVGHEPQMGQLTGLLLGVPAVAFRKSAVCSIEIVSGRRNALRWMRIPGLDPIIDPARL